eukprot:scaffold170867_cov35-Tisochrysis_lutea.AAC.2
MIYTSSALLSLSSRVVCEDLRHGKPCQAMARAVCAWMIRCNTVCRSHVGTGVTPRMRAHGEAVEAMARGTSLDCQGVGRQERRIR